MSTLRPHALVLAAAAAAILLAANPASPAGSPPREAKPDSARSSGWEHGIPGIAAFEGPWTSWERGLPARERSMRAGSPRSQDTAGPNLSFVRDQEAESASGFLPGMLGRLLVAEVAALRGGEADADRAVRSYVEGARLHAAPALAARAVRMAAGAERYGLAADASAEWRRLDPESRLARRMHALALARADRTEEAVAALRSIAGHWDEPGRSGHDVVVEVLRQEPDADRRIRIMEEVADAGPESRYALARVLAGSNRIDRALKLLEVLRRERPADNRYTITQALLLHGHGDRDAALDVLAAQSVDNDGGDGVLRTHARLLASAGRREQARDRYAALLARRPNDLEARWELGRLLTTMDRYDDARPHFRELYRWPGWRDGAWYFTGLIDEATAAPDQALRAYRRVREGVYYVSARIRSAEIMADTGQLRWARWHLVATPRRAESEDVRLYRAESGLLLGAERPHEAMTVLDGALDAYPEQAELLYARAMVAERIDRLDILESDLRSIIARDPDHAEALNALGYTLADRTDRYHEALELVERALALEPDQYHIVDSMGWVLYRLGRHEEAAEHLRRSYEGERDPVVAAHLGEVLWALGLRDEARDIWRSALEEAPDNAVLLETIARFGS